MTDSRDTGVDAPDDGEPLSPLQALALVRKRIVAAMEHVQQPRNDTAVHVPLTYAEALEVLAAANEAEDQAMQASETIAGEPVAATIEAFDFADAIYAAVRRALADDRADQRKHHVPYGNTSYNEAAIQPARPPRQVPVVPPPSRE